MIAQGHVNGSMRTNNLNPALFSGVTRREEKRFGPEFVPFLDIGGPLGAVLGVSGAISGDLGVVLGWSWGYLQRSWVLSGASWCDLGDILGRC